MSDPNQSEASPTPPDKGTGGGRPAAHCSRLSRPKRWCNCVTANYRVRAMATCCQACGGEVKPAPSAKEMSEAWHLLHVLSANMMDDGPTWPRVLEWLERNDAFRPENDLGQVPAPTTGARNSQTHE